VASLVAAMLAALASPALARHASKHPKLPDLVPKTVRVNGKPYAFLGKTEATAIDTTKNVGAVRARRTHTYVVLVHDGRRWLLTDRLVPALGPGESHRGEGSSPHPVGAPIGAYTLEICGDAKNQVRESNEDNNCAPIRRPSHFFVAAQTWFGSLSGTKVSAGSQLETWRSTNARLDFDGAGGGVFEYLFKGSVTWIDSGAVDKCVQDGKGTKTYDHDDSIGSLTVDYLNGTYSGNLNENVDGPFYEIQDSCGGQLPGPQQPDFWNPFPDGSPVALPFGSRTLPGSPTRFGDTTWVWDLKVGVLH
jgi:hypothetical protein